VLRRKLAAALVCCVSLSSNAVAVRRPARQTRVRFGLDDTAEKYPNKTARSTMRKP
jgi:hypothetical protein